MKTGSKQNTKKTRLENQRIKSQRTMFTVAEIHRKYRGCISYFGLTDQISACLFIYKCGQIYAPKGASSQGCPRRAGAAL